MPVPEIHDLRMPKRLRMMVAAHSGFGKTVFCGTAPNALFLTTDPEGTASAAAFGSTAREMEIHNQDELNDAYVYLEQGGIAELGLDFVIVDNLTEVQAMFMGAAMEAAVRQGEKKGSPRNPFVPDKYEYQVEQNATVDFVKRMNSLPVHVIFTAHLKGMEDGDANEFFSVAIRGKQGEIAQQCLGYMNVIGMGAVVDTPKGAARRMYFDHVGKYRGKDRFVKLGRAKDNLTVPDMMSLLWPNGATPAKAGPKRIVRKAS
jgi:hypothetical protein